MKKRKQLSLDEFKVKAKIFKEIEALETIKGGGMFDCHGFWGSVGKAMGHNVRNGQTISY